MRFFKIKSHAKINFSLNVISKLSSKLHKIESLVSFVSLHDVVYLRLINSDNHKVEFKGKYAKGIGRKNTVIKLLQILDKKKLLNQKKFEIKIIKNIPQKSGLGGGSMNAASIINFFLKKKIINLNKKKLIKFTKLIGSDVILGIDPKNTILSSNGKLTKYNKKIGFNALIVKPSFGCSTKLIYSKIRFFSKPKYNNPKKSLLIKNNIVNSSNDLEKIAFHKYSKLKSLKLFLLKLPNIVFARMTGSGSSIVAYFQSKKATVIASRVFKRKFKNYWCIVSKTI